MSIPVLRGLITQENRRRRQLDIEADSYISQLYGHEGDEKEYDNSEDDNSSWRYHQLVRSQTEMLRAKVNQVRKDASYAAAVAPGDEPARVSDYDDLINFLSKLSCANTVVAKRMLDKSVDSNDKLKQALIEREIELTQEIQVETARSEHLHKMESLIRARLEEIHALSTKGADTLTREVQRQMSALEAETKPVLLLLRKILHDYVTPRIVDAAQPTDGRRKPTEGLAAESVYKEISKFLYSLITCAVTTEGDYCDITPEVPRGFIRFLWECQLIRFKDNDSTKVKLFAFGNNTAVQGFLNELREVLDS